MRDRCGWLMEFLVPATGEGSLHKALVRDAAGQVLGWYLYYAGPAGLGEAVHIGARHASIKAVLEHLFQDAWRRDVVALSGRLEPRFTADFAQTYCLFHPRLCWMLVHSRDPEVLQAIHSGRRDAHASGRRVVYPISDGVPVSPSPHRSRFRSR